MGEFIYFIVFFAVIIPIALFLIFWPVFKHHKLLNGVVNYDTYMRKFVFKIELNKEEFYAQLKTKNISDSLEYSLSDDCTEIVFKKYNTKYQYRLLIQEYNKYIILIVEQVSTVSKVSHNINEFFMRKFGAYPLQYEKNLFK